MDLFETYPQVLINVKVRDRTALDRAEAVWEHMRAVEARLGDDGRVLLRASGTEPLVRVMVEAADQKMAQEAAADLAAMVERYLG